MLWKSEGYFFFEVTSELEFKVERSHSEAAGIAGRGTGMKKIVIRLEVTKEQELCSFLGVGRAGNSAGSVKSLVVVKLYWGTIEWGFRKKTGRRSLVTPRSVRNWS